MTTRHRWCWSIVVAALGVALSSLESSAGQTDHARLHGTGPTSCSANGAMLGMPGTVGTHVLERGALLECLTAATNREALECVAEAAARLLADPGPMDPAGPPIWFVADTKPARPWYCSADFRNCTCMGTDDCVDMILFGPCTEGTFGCTPPGGDVCGCDY